MTFNDVNSQVLVAFDRIVCGVIDVITLRTRSITSEKLYSAVILAIPNSFALAALASKRVVLIRALDGTQPVFRQSPAMRCFSISVTFALTAAAM